MLITLKSHGHKPIIIKDMMVHVVPVVGLESLRCPTVHVIGKETLGPRIALKKLLQAHAKVEDGTQRRVLGPQHDLNKRTKLDRCQNNK